MQSARKKRCRALILNGISGVFSQMSGAIWSFAWLSRTKKLSSPEIASALSRSAMLGLHALSPGHRLFVCHPGGNLLFFKEQSLITKNMIVAATAGKTDAIKILEDLNRQLAPDVQRIAEIRRAG